MINRQGCVYLGKKGKCTRIWLTFCVAFLQAENTVSPHNLNIPHHTFSTKGKRKRDHNRVDRSREPSDWSI